MVACLSLMAVLPLLGATRIGEVDFKNFDYVWDLQRVAVPSTWKWLEGRPQSSVRLAGGRHDFSGAERLAGGYVAISSVTYGDLTGVGRDEAAVDLLFGTGGTANWHYLYVFSLANGSPTILGRLRSGSRADGGLIRVAIRQRTLILDFADPNRRIGDCCSEGYVRVRYRWQNGRFVEAGVRETGDLERPE